MKPITLFPSCVFVARVLGTSHTVDSASTASPPVNAGSIASAGIALLAPLYRAGNVGQAWVFPSSAFDLGARSMGCECFNPEGKMPYARRKRSQVFAHVQ